MAEIKTKTKLKKEHHHEHVRIFIVKVNNEELQQQDVKAYERQICGRSMLEILARELQGYDVCFLETEYGKEEELVPAIKAGGMLCDKIAVIFSDQPCLTGVIIEDALKIVTNAIYFEKSFVCTGAFLKAMHCFCHMDEFLQEKRPEFLVVEGEESFLVASKIIGDKLIEYHKKNDVNIEDSVVDFDCEIDGRAQIFNSTLIGNCNVGLCLIDGSTVIDSIVASGVKIENSFVKNCIVASDVKNKKIENTNFLGDEK